LRSSGGAIVAAVRSFAATWALCRFFLSVPPKKMLHDLCKCSAGMFAILAQARNLRAVAGVQLLQQLWGPNDDTYDTTDYFM
jgi:hypothetical protein